MEHLINAIYVYCTDFIINLANIFDLSYYEINTLLFCMLYPLLTVGLTAVYLIQLKRLKKIRTERKINH
ncbi:MAG: hypothetical protein R2824_13465 [Saprospiraceae bacterium]|nr:hypothetical protein [Lewinella sp.]